MLSLLNDAKIRGEAILVVYPKMQCSPIEGVNLGIGALLFNDKNLDSKPENLIEALEGQIIKGRRFNFIHKAATSAEKPARTMAAETRTAVQWMNGRR
jgi:hypothetical protein|tara:strand:- start:910 stop:1203 length:294 start_codon:yes stop_codon:yes gene_type:complete